MKRIPILSVLLCLCLLLCGCGGRPAAAAAPTAADHLAAAQAALEGGDYAAARESYRAADALYPLDAGALRGELRALRQLDAAPEELIAAYEALYACDALEEDDYRALAELYLVTGATRQARDLLERGQCLVPTAEKAGLLAGLTVDIADDTPAVRAALTPAFESLAAGDAEGAADALLALGLGQVDISSRVVGGGRRYTAQGSEAVLCVLPDRLLLAHTRGEGMVIQVWLTAEELFVSTARCSGGAYAGAFTTLLCKAANGSIVSDAGTAQNGIVTGEVSTELSGGGEAAALKTLWDSRKSRESTSYTGELDAAGHAAAPQPEGLESGKLVYAYEPDSQKYVYILTDAGESVQSYVFTPASFGLTDPAL